MVAHNISMLVAEEETPTTTVRTMVMEETEASDYLSPPIDPTNWTDLDSIVNVTKEYPFEYANIMFGYLMPGILLLTLITNTLVVAVLCQRHMRSPTNIVLVTMALVDMATLLFPAPWYFYIYTLGHHDKFLHSTTVCYLYHIMTDVIPIYFHTSSIWLTLFLAFQRYIYVCHPTQAATWCTVPRVKRAIAMIMFVAFCHQMSRFIDYSFVSVRIQSGDGYQTACKMDVAQWVQYLDGELYYTAYFLFRIVFVSIIPCVALIVLNLLLFLALKRAKLRRKKLLESKFGLMREQCSVVTDMNAHRSSYQDTNAYPLISASSLMANGQVAKSAALPAPKKTLGIASKIVDKTRRFSTIFSDRGDVSDHKSQPESSRIHFCSPADQTSDTKVSCSMLSDDLAATEQQQQQQQHTGDHVNNQKRQKQRKPSEAATDNHQSIDKQNHRADSLQRPTETDRLLDCAGRHEDKNDEEYIDTACKNELEDDEEEFTCAECAASCADEELDCQRCLARSCHFHHQAVSQCSSLLGGATYTTTNDDVSSCAITQNVSSSIYVTHDETLDAIEAESMREEEAGNVIVVSEDLKRNVDVSSVDIDESSAKRPKVHGAGVKVRRQLTCGCGASMYRQTFSCRSRSDAPAAASQAGDCKECCAADCTRISNMGRQSHSFRNGSTRRDTRTTGECVTSCSNSDSFMMNCSLDKPRYPLAAQSSSGKRWLHNSDDQSAANKISLYADKGRALYTANPDQASGRKVSLARNFTGSLKRTHSRSVLLDGQSCSQFSADKEPQPAGRQIKSPSFASSTGRGSRATLVGIAAAQSTPGVGGGGGSGLSQTATASFKTIESNRTTIMLMVVVTVFLAVEVPVAITTIIHVFLNIFDVHKAMEFGSTMSYIKLFTNFAIMISYSINFTIYCSMSKKFRETFRDLFSWFGRTRVRLWSSRRGQEPHRLNLYHSKSMQIQHTNSLPSCNGQPEDINNQLVSSNSNKAAVIESARVVQRDHATGGNNVAAGTMRCSPTLRRASSSQQQECEL